MWDDDDNEKQLRRSQYLAILLMTAMLFLMFQWMAPRPIPKQPETVNTSGQPEAPQGGVAPADTPAGGRDGARPSIAGAGTVLPFLPPIPESVDPRADEVTIENDHLRLVLTRIGARVKRATVILGAEGESSIQLVPEAPSTPDTEAVYPMGLRFTKDFLNDELDRRRWEVVKDETRRTPRSIAYEITLPSVAVIRKTFTLGDGRHVLNVNVEYQSLESAPRVLGMDETPAFALNWGPNVSSHDEAKGIHQAFLWHTPKENIRTATANMAPQSDGTPFLQTVEGTEWTALKSAYFIVAFQCDFPKALGWASGSPTAFRFGMAAPRTEIPANGVLGVNYQVYIGPSELSSLKAAWATLPQALRFFDTFDSMDWFAKFLLSILNWFHHHLHVNYGIAIILLTVLVRVAMFPLTLKSMKSMKKMQMLAPEMEQLKEKHKDDPQELQKKIMEMYRERGVNPMGGCLPMLLQMPVFIALYNMLNSAFELRGSHFFWWMTDLSQPDRLVRLFNAPWAAHVPILGSVEYLNVLPIVMGVVMVISMKVVPTSGPAINPQQKMMMTLMPVMFSVFCYNLASGLSLYMLTTTILSMVQQHFIHISKVELSAKKTPKKKQHFFTAAQAKKRQMAKEAKEDSRKQAAARRKDAVATPKRPEQPDTR